MILDLTSRRELPYITSAVLHLPLEIYHLLATAVGGVPNLMQVVSSRATSSSHLISIGMHYCRHL
jgi:hypothetical protein